MATFYEQRMLGLFERYELPPNTPFLLKAYEDYLTKTTTEAALGRLIRISPNNRIALSDTMAKCAEIMSTKVEETKHCLTIIKTCQKMLEIADKEAAKGGFPGFLQLPIHLRFHIYDMYQGNDAGRNNPIVMIPIRSGRIRKDRERPRKVSCYCPAHASDSVMGLKELIPMNLAFTSKAIADEVLGNFFKQRTIHFVCPCEMKHVLTKQPVVKYNIKSLMFHWCGPDAHKAIALLGEMTGENKNLKYLTVIISKVTSRYHDAREEEIRKYFHGRKARSSLPGSRGWDELMSIRALESVNVENIDKKKGERRAEQDRDGLERMLRSKVLQK
ncbi:hypothetical protein F5Y16DRAFT_420613 [Xylariaceae sp. FL0255]|nr:hypothetical protein F5Y16DRAFT_420613 [Xylariaceae sp. FL0255]